MRTTTLHSYAVRLSISGTETLLEGTKHWRSAVKYVETSSLRERTVWPMSISAGYGSRITKRVNHAARKAKIWNVPSQRCSWYFCEYEALGPSYDCPDTFVNMKPWVPHNDYPWYFVNMKPWVPHNDCPDTLWIWSLGSLIWLCAKFLDPWDSGCYGNRDVNLAPWKTSSFYGKLEFVPILRSIYYQKMLEPNKSTCQISKKMLEPNKSTCQISKKMLEPNKSTCQISK